MNRPSNITTHLLCHWNTHDFWDMSLILIYIWKKSNNNKILLAIIVLSFKFKLLICDIKDKTQSIITESNLLSMHYNYVFNIVDVIQEAIR